jgi:hypothetical protein
MIKLAATCAVLTLCATTIAAPAAPAHAAVAYGSFVLQNPTDVPVEYDIQWGEAEWEPFVLEPHSQRAHFQALGPDQATEIALIRFIHVIPDEIFTQYTYELEVQLTDTATLGKRYTFQFTSGRHGLDLFED